MCKKGRSFCGKIIRVVWRTNKEVSDDFLCSLYVKTIQQDERVVRCHGVDDETYLSQQLALIGLAASAGGLAVFAGMRLKKYVSTKIRNISEIVSRANAVISRVTDSADKITEVTSDVAGGIRDLLNLDIGKFTSFLQLALDSTVIYSWFQKARTTVDVVMGFYLTFRLVGQNGIAKAVTQLFKVSPDAVKTHAGEHPFEAFIKVVLTLVGTITTGCFSTGFVASFFRVAGVTGLIDALKTGAKVLSDVLTDLMTKFITWIFQGRNSEFAERVQEKCRNRIAVADAVKRTPLWIVEASKRLGMASDPSRLQQREFAEAVLRLRKEGEELYVLMNTLNDLHAFPLRVQMAQRIKELIEVESSTSKALKSALRAEPVCLYIAGPAGVGKSQLVGELDRTICALTGYQSEYNQSQSRYTFNLELNYWDTYHGQLITVLDDAFKSLHQNAKEDRTASVIISCVNSAPYVVPMASIAEKGTCFSSKFLICTSNYLFPFGTVESSALSRRFHRVVLALKRDPNGVVGDPANRVLKVCKSFDNWPAGQFRNGYTKMHDHPSTLDAFNAWSYRDHFEDVTVDQLARDACTLYAAHNAFHAQSHAPLATNTGNPVFDLGGDAHRIRLDSGIDAQAGDDECTGEDECCCQSCISKNTDSQVGGDADIVDLTVQKYRIDNFTESRGSLFVGASEGERSVEYVYDTVKSTFAVNFEIVSDVKLLRGLDRFVFDYCLSHCFYEVAQSVFPPFDESKRVDARLRVEEKYQAGNRVLWTPQGVLVLCELEDGTFDFFSLKRAILTETTYDAKVRSNLDKMSALSSMIGLGEMSSYEWFLYQLSKFCVSVKRVANDVVAGAGKMYRKFCRNNRDTIAEARSYCIVFVVSYVALTLFVKLFSAVMSLFAPKKRNRAHGTWAEEMDEVDPQQLGPSHKGSGNHVNNRGKRGPEKMSDEDYSEDELSGKKVAKTQNRKKNNSKGGRRQRMQNHAHGLDKQLDIDDFDVEVGRSGEEYLLDHLADAYVKIQITCGSFSINMNAINLGSHCIMLPSHAFPPSCKGKVFSVRVRDQAGFNATVNIRHSSVVYGTTVKAVGVDTAKSDVCIVHIPDLPLRRNVVKHFAHEVMDLAVFKRPLVMAIAATATHIQSFTHQIEQLSETTSLDNENNSYAIHAYKVRNNTFVSGDCGNLLLHKRGSAITVVGMYIAGNLQAETGYYQPLTKGFVDAMMEKIGVVKVAGFESYPVVTGPPNAFVSAAENFAVLGEWEYSSPAVKNIGQSEIRVSPFGQCDDKLFGTEPLFAPAQLNPEAARRAFKKKDGFAKVETVSYTVLSEATSWLKESLKLHVGACKKLSQEEAITGSHLSNAEPSASMEMSSSPGLPWTLTRPVGTSGKGYLFDYVPSTLSERTYFKPRSVLQQAIDNHFETWKRGELNPCLFRESLKDERRDIERVLAAKTRLFSAAPVEKVIVDRIVLGDFENKYKHARQKLFHAIGIDATGLEWNDLGTAHKNFGTKHIAYDFSGFDSSLPLCFITAAYDAIASLYPEDERRDVVFAGAEIAENWTIFFGNVIPTHKGNPSGHFLTTVLNSLVNTLVVMYCYICCARRAGVKVDRGKFVGDVLLTTYGDDLIMTVSDLCADWFTPRYFCEISTEMGLEATAADKHGSVCVWLPFGDLAFLKRKFVRGCNEDIAPMVLVGPLPKEVIQEIPRWMHSGADFVALKSTIVNACAAAALWGRRYYTWYTEQLMSCGSSECVGVLNEVAFEQIYCDVIAKFGSRATMGRGAGENPGGAD